MRKSVEQLLAALSGDQITVALSNEDLDTEHGIRVHWQLPTQWRAAIAPLARKQLARLLLLAGDCAAEVAPFTTSTAAAAGR